MYPYCPAVPWMPRIPDFTVIPNMGVVLLSCIIASAIIKGRGTFCYSLVLRRYRGAGCHRSSVASASAVSSSITIAGPHEFLDHAGFRVTLTKAVTGSRAAFLHRSHFTSVYPLSVKDSQMLSTRCPRRLPCTS